MTNWRQNLLRLAIGSAATGAFLWLFLRIAHLGEAWKEIRSLPAWSILAGVGFVLANTALIALRWRYLYAAARYRTQTRRLFTIFCVGAAANNVLPARGGDLLRIEAVITGRLDNLVQAAVSAFTGETRVLSAELTLAGMK